VSITLTAGFTLIKISVTCVHLWLFFLFELNLQPMKQTEISDYQNLANLAFALRFGLKLNNKFVD
jgi:hypothetical protein